MIRDRNECASQSPKLAMVRRFGVSGFDHSFGFLVSHFRVSLLLDDPQTAHDDAAGMSEAGNFLQRWYGRPSLLLLGVGLLTAAFAPVNQFYLAWIGLVPWLVVVHNTRSKKSAFFWSWIAGTLFFIANMWWMAKVTVAGMIALMAVLGLYWGVAGVVIRAVGGHEMENGKWKMENGAEERAFFFHLPFTIYHFPLLRCISIAAAWVATAELLRGSWPWHGLPWLYLGYTQTPVLVMCQIADVTGVLGVSFLVALVNAWVAMWVLNEFRLRGLGESGVRIAGLVLLVAVYGVFRMENERLTAGPTVVVVQPNYPQDNSTGNKGASEEEMLDFHVRATESAIQAHPGVDLTVWSETIMPPFNPEARVGWRGWTVEEIIDNAKDRIATLAREYHSAFLVGGLYQGDFAANDKGQPEPADKRNSAYFFDSQGELSPLRYDKIHLVPFGEFIPFKEGFPALYRVMISLGPPDMNAYALQAGSDDHLTVYELQPGGDRPAWRFVTPICFEDIDPGLCAKMFRPESSAPDKKRADFLVNITNDGWFLANENSQHLQAAIFRSIENRVPSVRSVNTGISGFIDPLGHTSGLLPARTEGTSTSSLLLDSRVAFFTVWGQVFAWICVGVAGMSVVSCGLSVVKNSPTQKPQLTTDN